MLTERPRPGRHRRSATATSGGPRSERLIDFRDRGNEHRFFDLSFEAVQRDPIGQVTQLYAELGDDLSDEARQRMHDWWAESSKDRSGPGSYPPETFGLDPAAIAEQFAFYYRRFDVPVAP